METPLQPPLEEAIAPRPGRNLQDATAPILQWRCAPRPPPRTCPTPPLPASRKPSSTCAAWTGARKIHAVFASLYNDRAIAYRVHHGFEHADVALSAGVQIMVRSDIGAAGVMFTLDTESGFRDVVFITASPTAWAKPWCRARSTRRVLPVQAGSGSGRPILRRNLGSKAIEMVYSDGAGRRRDDRRHARRPAPALFISDAGGHSNWRARR
jgi:pyruvate, water dikinase